MEFEPVIGLEVHAQLKTRTKIFCGCSTAFGAAPNTQTCPVCLGMPGVLPVLNRTVVDYALRMALATGCSVARESRFARKNYFYPDLPKGYQISQYELPIAEHGHIDIDADGRTAARAHPPDPHGRGRRQAHPRPAPAGQPRGPQPHGGPPDRDRERAGHRLAGGGGRLPAAAARDRPLPRDLRRQPRGGGASAATRTCPSAPGAPRPSAPGRN